LSLHRSTSGFDLPMKLVEMRAVGLPVCALDYGDVLRERYRDGEGIRFFSNAETLVALLEELLEGWPKPKRLDALRPNPDDAVPNAWESEWRARVEPVLRSHLPRRS
jgi:beta-1,4-mannosyltransferase